MLNHVFERLQRCQLMRVRIETVSLDWTIVKVHPDDIGAAKKNGSQALGRSRGGSGTKVHMVAADARNVISWSLTGRQAGDAPEGRRLIQGLGQHHRRIALLMDRAIDRGSAEIVLTSPG